MSNRDYRDREPNAIERDRMERRQQTKRKSMITSVLVVVVALAVIIGIIVAVVALVGKNKNESDNTEPTAVTATIASETVGATEKTAETTKPQATQPRDPALANRDASSQNDDQQQETYASDSSSSSSSSSSSGSVSGGGNVLHYKATGQTSYGYDWTYSGGAGIVSITCSYDFSTHQYDFAITGVAPGTTSFTLYYNTDDGVQQPVDMTVQVDNNLNVTQIG